MPLARYFLYMGGALLALLLVVDWYLRPLDAAPAIHSDVDRSTIRIHSKQKWPQAIVIDTTLPTIVPPLTETAAAQPPAARVARPAREALAMAVEPAPAKPKESVKAAKPRVRHARLARATVPFAPTPFGIFNLRGNWPAGW